MHQSLRDHASEQEHVEGAQLAPGDARRARSTRATSRLAKKCERAHVDRHVLLAVDEAAHRFELPGVAEQRRELRFLAVDPGSAPGVFPAHRSRLAVRHDVGLRERDEMATATKHPLDDLAVAVVGVCHEIDRAPEAKPLDHDQELVEERPLVAVGEHGAVVDLRRERLGEHGASGVREHRDGLGGVAHDEGGLGVRLAPLVQALPLSTSSLAEGERRSADHGT